MSDVPVSVDRVPHEIPARPRSVRAVLWNTALIVICVVGLADWLSAKTHRLYLEDDSEKNRQAGDVSQHFPIEGNRVVPQIITRGAVHFVFPLHLRVSHTLRVELKPQEGASFEIFRTAGGARELLASETVARRGKRVVSISGGQSDLEFVANGSLAWRDPRLTRDVFLWPLYGVAGLALMFSIGRHLRAGTPRVAEWVTLFVTVALSLLVLESVLRHYRSRLPPAIMAARTQLGVIPPDGRLVDPARYKVRLRANLNTYAQWRDGDITRLGFIPKNVSRRVRHRFAIRTDAEGFRNPAVREKIDVAALGDSFTDGATEAAEEAWPARLEQRTGLAVQNYGTLGFGPQQERYVAQDFALRHHPRWTVLAFFGGNDLRDAEVFDDWERGANRPGEELNGAKLSADYRRYHSFYLWTLASLATDTVLGSTGGASTEATSVAAESDAPRFDRGMFEVPVNGRMLQFAFFPPYLQKLGMTPDEIEASRGWALTRATLTALKAECAENGSAFVLMFIPSKEQVYWPLVERSFPTARIQEAVDFHCRNVPPDADAVGAQRLALNGVLRNFCAKQGIPMLDLTDALTSEVAAGREVFFPDDTHWNATGHDVAARELAKFLNAP